MDNVCLLITASVPRSSNFTSLPILDVFGFPVVFSVGFLLISPVIGGVMHIFMFSWPLEYLLWRRVSSSSSEAGKKAGKTMSSHTKGKEPLHLESS